MKQILATIGVVAALATTATAQSTLDPDCVLYYDFETMGSDPNKVANGARNASPRHEVPTVTSTAIFRFICEVPDGIEVVKTNNGNGELVFLTCTFVRRTQDVGCSGVIAGLQQ